MRAIVTRPDGTVIELRGKAKDVREALKPWHPVAPSPFTFTYTDTATTTPYYMGTVVCDHSVLGTPQFTGTMVTTAGTS